MKLSRLLYKSALLPRTTKHTKFVTHRFSTLHLLCCSCLALLLFFLSLSSFSVAETLPTRKRPTRPTEKRKPEGMYMKVFSFLFFSPFPRHKNPSSPNRLRTTKLISVPRFLLLCFSPAQNLSRPQNPFAPRTRKATTATHKTPGPTRDDKQRGDRRSSRPRSKL